MVTRDISGTVIILPVNFPNEVEIRVVPHSKKTGLAFDGSFPIKPHRSWAWVRQFYAVRTAHLDACEQVLSEGKPVTLVVGEFPVEFEKESDYPSYLEE